MNTLSRREQFAMAAMQSILITTGTETYAHCADLACAAAATLEAALDSTEKKDVESAPLSTLATLSRDFILEQRAHAETAAKLKSAEEKIGKVLYFLNKIGFEDCGDEHCGQSACNSARALKALSQ